MPCYTEDDVQYKVELDGLTNLNSYDEDKHQASMEDCRTYCRHLNSLILQWSVFTNIFPRRDTYEEAEYFTYNLSNSPYAPGYCWCKTDNNLDVTRRDAYGRVSGNVQCDESM